ncbi:hypothetical protein QQ045_026895 [Rhodiola kirilowii]
MNNICGDPGYWLWLCAKVCKEEEFKRCGGAGAILYSGGLVKEVGASYLENCSSVLEAEIKALHLGVKIALVQNLAKVKIFTDSKEVLWAINM